MTVLTRQQILSADDLKSKRVKVPEWGGDVFVRELTAAERDEYESSIVKTDGLDVTVNATNMRAKLVSMSVVDKDGKRLFTAKDVVKLGEKSAAVIDRIVDVSRRLSRIGPAELEELGKGLRAVESGASAST